MKVDVLNMDGEKVRTVNLPEKIFKAPISTDLMHQAYLR
ncbi:MAG: 50S ribosomal protein L4, partial [Chloroflexi bacterium]|nr:50S ribosomal protein L4 [Chloroflexota bacterium]